MSGTVLWKEFIWFLAEYACAIFLNLISKLLLRNALPYFHPKKEMDITLPEVVLRIKPSTL